MKRLDEGKTSWVDFLRSIRYTRHHSSKSYGNLSESFAGLSPQTRGAQTHTGEKSNAERKSSIRSAD